jgi:hypothetical protein
MQTVALTAPSLVSPAFTWPASGTQFLPVTGHVTDRLFVTYRAPARALAPLVPEPFELDTRDGFAFLSVCAVEIVRMGIAGTPRFLRFDNREFLYRLAVRLGGESTFVTLRSDVSSPVLALLGRYFSHYRPRRAAVRLFREASSVRMECLSRDGSGDAVLDVDTAAEAPASGSVFGSAEEATRFLLGMRFSADSVRGRVRVQPIDHSPWSRHFVPSGACRFAFASELGVKLGTSFEHDGTLATRDVDQQWRAARWI